MLKYNKRMHTLFQFVQFAIWSIDAEGKSNEYANLIKNWKKKTNISQIHKKDKNVSM